VGRLLLDARDDAAALARFLGAGFLAALFALFDARFLGAFPRLSVALSFVRAGRLVLLVGRLVLTVFVVSLLLFGLLLFGFGLLA